MKRIAAVLLAALALGSAGAQDFPNKPIRLIVGFAPGGAADILGRLVAQHLTPRVGQPITVENRPGANGGLAAQAVMASAPDGYTLLVTPSGPITLEPNIRKPRRYDPLQVFAPVVMTARFPFILVTSTTQPFNTGPEFLAAAKANPRKFSFVSSGNGSLNHLGGEYFNMRSGTDLVHVPYKGDGASMADLMAGLVTINMLPAPSAIPQVQGGKLKALGTMDTVRTPSLPNVPTLAEQGMQGFEMGSWIGVFAPAGTPAAVVEKLNREISAALSTDDAKRQLAGGAMSHQPMSPAQFEAQIRRESARWQEVAEKAKISLTD